MTGSGIATAADYSEAIGVAKRAKSVIALLLLLMLVAQVTIFCLVQFKVIEVGAGGTTVDVPEVTTQSVDTETKVVDTSKINSVMQYVTGVTLLGGIGLSIVLSLVLMIITHIMLVGRLIGVGKLTSSVIWSLILLVFFFPWQTFMNNAQLTDPTWRIPGVLWTWGELIVRTPIANDWSGDNWANTLLSWFRFVGAPLVAIILVLIVQLKSNRGVRMAMGEDETINQVMGDTAI